MSHIQNMAISFVKSFSLKRSPENRGYTNKVTVPETLTDDDDEDDDEKFSPSYQQDPLVSENIFESKSSTHKPSVDGPFSALTPSMWPQDLLATYFQPEDSQPLSKYDEFGFIIEKTSKRKESEKPKGQGNEIFFTKKKKKNDELRAKWISYLEFTYNESALPQMKWSQVENQMKHSKVLDELVKCGLPMSMRAQLWMRFSKGMTLQFNSKWSYSQMCDQSNHVQILSDPQILSVLPSNACFSKSNSIGIIRLRRILRVTKWLQRSGSNPLPDSVNNAVIVAYLLLICDEEIAFWLSLSCLNELKSFDHQTILKELISDICPEINEVFKQDEIDISLITSHWFSSLFAGFISNTSVLLLLWDLYFYYGSIVLFQLTIGLFLEKKSLFENCDNSAVLFNRLSDLTTHITGRKSLIKYWERGYHLINYIKKDSNSSCLHRMNNVSSLISLPSFTSENENDIKTKNIRQTSILIELHEAISAIGKHFESYDHKFKPNLQPDYTKADGCDENELNSKTCKANLRRAKALIDFKRHDSDELGFRKNDIITIINERDEHCWIGELNGIRGWFPAKFVEMLDERNGEYSMAGDDRVVPFINDLVRGRLCNAMKAILCHGLRKTLFITVHPWNVIETITSSCIESDFNSVYSRLVLTRTFKLDEFSRVLTPCEVLYRSVAHINQTHEYEPMDVKLRSLIVIGLNQKILHDWFSVICATQPHILAKYYDNWSFVNSPVWKMIRAELKLLVQFSFNLDIGAELQESNQSKSPVSKDGVKDMLVKHHLFSWDL